MYGIKVAAGFLQRARGLIGRPAGYLSADQMMCFPQCSSVHTFWMRCSIDVAFLDDGGTVLKVVRSLPPWRICRCRGAVLACERPARPGEAWLVEGERLCLCTSARRRGGDGA